MRILLAEDDQNLNHPLTKRLTVNGFTVDSCYDGEEALYLAQQAIHDVILLDRMLPLMEGTEVLTALRNQNIGIPVILITALGTLSDKVTGLNLGADDYLVKPFAFEELLARIQCIARRSPVLNMNSSLELYDLSYNRNDGVLTGPKGNCSLSRREGSLMEVFLKSENRTISRTTLILKVWGPESDIEEGNLDNYIHFLRRRLKQVGSSLNLKTIRGVVYCLQAPS